MDAERLRRMSEAGDLSAARAYWHRARRLGDAEGEQDAAWAMLARLSPDAIHDHVRVLRTAFRHRHQPAWREILDHAPATVRLAWLSETWPNDASNTPHVALQQAIESLYAVFPEPEPERVGDALLARRLERYGVRGVPLHALRSWYDGSLLEHSGRATFWGMLPRALERLHDKDTEPFFRTYAAAVLDASDWTTWPVAQQTAVYSFFEALWLHALSRDVHLEEQLAASAELSPSALPIALKLWEHQLHRFEHVLRLARFMLMNAMLLLRRASKNLVGVGLSSWSPEHVEVIAAWLRAPALHEALERARGQSQEPAHRALIERVLAL